MFPEIYWVDGNSDVSGFFVLEIIFKNGGRSFWKNRDAAKILEYRQLFSSCPGVVAVNQIHSA